MPVYLFSCDDLKDRERFTRQGSTAGKRRYCKLSVEMVQEGESQARVCGPRKENQELESVRVWNQREEVLRSPIPFKNQEPRLAR